MAGLFALKLKSLASAMKQEHFSFWAACGYLLVEYVRPQSILPSIDVLPWGQLFVLLAIGSWVFDARQRWVRDPTNKWMILFLFTIVLASLTAYWPDLSWSHFMDFFGWFIIYFLIVNIVNSERRLFLFLLLFLLASFKLSQHGARTWAMRGFSFENWGLMGPEGPFQNSGELAVQMLMFMPIAYRLAVAIRPWLSRLKFWLLMLLPVTASMTVAGASSRGSQIGLAVQVYHTFLKGRWSFRTVVITVAAVGLAVSLLPAEQWDRFRNAGSDDTSQQRLLYWKHGLEMIKDHPVLGVGYFNFSSYYTVHHPDDILFGNAQLPHNIFVQVGTDAGLLGLAIYLALIISSFRSTRAIRRKLDNNRSHWLYSVSFGYDAALIGFLIAGQFVTIGYYPFMWVQLALTAATRNIVLNDRSFTVLSPAAASLGHPPPASQRQKSVKEETTIGSH